MEDVISGADDLYNDSKHFFERYSENWSLTGQQQQQQQQQQRDSRVQNPMSTSSTLDERLIL